MGTPVRRVWVGIDPGLSGAVGAVYGNRVADAWSTPTISVKKAKGKGAKRHPDPSGMADLLRPFLKLRREGWDVLVTLEESSPNPVDGKIGHHKVGIGFGTWLGILAALRLPYQTVRPSIWRPQMVGAKTDKNMSRKVCMELFPRLKLPLVKDSDKAEAVMIAEWGRRRDLGLEAAGQKKKAIEEVEVNRPARVLARRPDPPPITIEDDKAG